MVIDTGPKKYDETKSSSEWAEKYVQKDLTEPALLEMSGYALPGLRVTSGLPTARELPMFALRPVSPRSAISDIAQMERATSSRTTGARCQSLHSRQEMQASIRTSLRR